MELLQAPGLPWTIYHPHIQARDQAPGPSASPSAVRFKEPEHTKKIVGETKGLARSALERHFDTLQSLQSASRYIPKNYRHQQFIESVRSGECSAPFDNAFFVCCGSQKCQVPGARLAIQYAELGLLEGASGIIAPYEYTDIRIEGIESSFHES